MVLHLILQLVAHYERQQWYQHHPVYDMRLPMSIIELHLPVLHFPISMYQSFATRRRKTVWKQPWP